MTLTQVAISAASAADILTEALYKGKAVPEDDCPVGDEDLTEHLLDAVQAAMERLFATRFGDRHRHLDASREEAALAIMGQPVDDRPGWTALGTVLRGMVLNDVGCVLSNC